MAIVSTVIAAVGAIGGAIAAGGTAATLGAAALSAAGSIISGNEARAAAERAAGRQREEAGRLLSENEKAQLLLQKSKDEAISDNEANELFTKGLITQATKDAIDTLNASAGVSIQTLRDFLASDIEENLATEAEILAELVNNGEIERDVFDDSFRAIENFANSGAVSALSIIEKSGAMERDALTKSVSNAYNTIENMKGEQLDSLMKKGVITQNQLEQANVGANNIFAESTSDILANLEQQGAIQREDRIAATDRAVQTLDTGLGEYLKSAVQSGLLSRQALQNGALASITSALHFDEKAIAHLQPFIEQGERALLQNRVLSGTATESERAEFTQKFGDPSISELAKLRIAEDEEAINRMQKSRGGFFSGAATKELLNNGSRRIVAEEAQRQLANSNTQIGLGLNASGHAANINQQTDNSISGINERLGQNLNANYLNEGQRIGQGIQSLRGAQASLQNNLGQDLVNITGNNGQQKNAAISQFGQLRGNNEFASGQSQSNVTMSFTNMQNAVLERYGLSLFELEQQYGRDIAARLADSAARSVAIEQSRTQNLINNNQNNAGLVGDSYRNQSNQSNQTRASFNTARTALNNTAATNISNTQLGLGQQSTTIGLDGASNIANFSNASSANRNNIRLGAGSNQVQAGLNFNSLINSSNNNASNLLLTGDLEVARGIAKGMEPIAAGLNPNLGSGLSIEELKKLLNNKRGL